MHIKFRWGNPKEISHLEDLGVDGSTILKRNSNISINCRKFIEDLKTHSGLRVS
jgi:hypothetical protein